MTSSMDVEPSQSVPQSPQKASWPRFGPFIVLAILLAIYAARGSGNGPSAALAGWTGDFDAALLKAKPSESKLLVAFSMKGCPPCVAMDRMVLGTPPVKAALRSFVPVRIDVDEYPEIANRYSVFGTPTYAIVNAKGELLIKCEGYQPVSSFVTFLERGSALGGSSGLKIED